MIEEVPAIEPTSRSTMVQVENSTSITAEPDNVLVAHRQSEITARLENDENLETTSGNPHKHLGENQKTEDAVEEKEARLSGESERIGTGEWDPDIPFGEHFGYL